MKNKPQSAGKGSVCTIADHFSAPLVYSPEQWKTSAGISLQSSVWPVAAVVIRRKISRIGAGRELGSDTSSSML